ncbi:MAG: hypothetical protein HQL74_08785 [Magnetococcales bacterium]|nr:hypothetical protein [Magnetococcales bacterium]
MDERQAEVQAEAMVDLVEDRLATKRDIADLKRDIKELDTKTETRLKELELRMVIKMGGMILAGIGILFGLMRAWPLPVQFVPAQEIRHTVPTALPGK